MEFVRKSGPTHRRTSPHQTQSNGQPARFHHAFKGEGWRPTSPLTIEDARKVAGEFIRRFGEERLHSGISYVTPKTRPDGRHEALLEERDRKLDQARQRRAGLRATARRAATDLRSVA